MRRTAIVLSGLLVSFSFATLCASRAAAQSAPLWSGIIAPSRAIDWSQAGVPGGIPVRTTICATISPEGSASAPVAPTDINNAIAQCPAGQVVYLEPGDYYLSSGIDFADHNSVSLRGAGASQTLLHFSGPTGCDGLFADICIRNATNTWTGNNATIANWTANYSEGTTQITLDNTSGIVPGHTILILDQLNDSNTDNGQIWVCDTNGTCANEAPSGGYRSGRAQSQIVLATAVSGNTVTISPGIYMPNWRASQSPQAWWSTPPATGDGVEDLSMDDSASSASYGITVHNGYGNWISGVRDVETGVAHVLVDQSAHVTVQSCYFYGTKNAASESYGVEGFLESDNRIENNIFQHIVSPITLNGASVGTVAAYNFSTDDYYAQSPNWMMQAYWLHSAGIAFDLFEENVGAGVASDDIHGTHDLVTFYRNQLSGWEPNKTNNTIAFAIKSFSRYFNVIGNVLGEPGYSNLYQDAPPTGPNQAAAEVYNIGWEPSGLSIAPDLLTGETLFRWENYDVVTGAVQANSAEIPSSLSFLANPIPSASQALPASFFSSGIPAFWITPWGTPPWPAIGPDVTGGPGPGGHAYDLPAGLCFKNSAADAAYGSSGVLLFDAGKCYGQPPAPPSNLNATVQ